MRRPWSISTTVRNPERLRDFLSVLKVLEGKPFNEENQILFQILLIQYRFYKPNRIPIEYQELFNGQSSIPFEIAEKVFLAREYRDPAMRGRQSVNPLNKLGFCIARESMGPIKITNLGNTLLNPNNDIGNIFFRSLLKLQFPNPISQEFTKSDGFNTTPFISTLHLLNRINSQYDSRGLSKKEFYIFIPTLIAFNKIGEQIDKIINYRKSRHKEEFIIEFLKDFYETNNISQKHLNDLFDYGDNILRFFRLTRFFRINLNETSQIIRIDLEPSRKEEIEQLINLYDGHALDFLDANSYFGYLSNINLPHLPWEEINKLKDVINSFVSNINQTIKNNKIDISQMHASVLMQEINSFSKKELTNHLQKLREINFDLKRIIRKKQLKSNIEYCKKIIEILNDRKQLRLLSPEQFEKLIHDALLILNDEILIVANYPIDDEGEPINHATGNKPDIEVHYDLFEGIYEVTLNVSNKQWVLEGQPVMRHLRDFEQQAKKDVFCIFISPTIHRDTLNTFWVSVKHDYEGKKQNIIPLTTSQFSEILEIFIVLREKNKTLTNKNFYKLLKILNDGTVGIDNSLEWQGWISSSMNRWKKNILSYEN